MQSLMDNQEYDTKKVSVVRRFLFMVVFTIFSCQIGVAQFTIPDKPKNVTDQTSVYDYYELLSDTEKNNLEQKLIKYSDTTSTQIVVVIFNSTNGENINYLGAQWGHKWGIGQAKEDNGILILLARDDRKIAISSGYGVEHLLTDAMSKRIIEQDILPYFRQNDYYEGLNRGADAIFEVMTGEYKGIRKNTNTDGGMPIGFIFFMIIVFIFIMISISKNRRGGGGSGGRNSGDGFSLLDAIILSNMGRSSSGGGFGGGFGGSSGGGGGFGGGGFGGGFGGGGFGGGGASGGW